MMAARLSRRGFGLIYTNQRTTCLFLFLLEPGGGDSFKGYFVDGREEPVQSCRSHHYAGAGATGSGPAVQYIMTIDGRL